MNIQVICKCKKQPTHAELERKQSRLERDVINYWRFTNGTPESVAEKFNLHIEYVRKVIIKHTGLYPMRNAAVPTYVELNEVKKVKNQKHLIRHAQVLELYHIFNMSFMEIANEIGVSHARVGQILGRYQSFHYYKRERKNFSSYPYEYLCSWCQNPKTVTKSRSQPKPRFCSPRCVMSYKWGRDPRWPKAVRQMTEEEYRFFNRARTSEYYHQHISTNPSIMDRKNQALKIRVRAKKELLGLIARETINEMKSQGKLNGSSKP